MWINEQTKAVFILHTDIRYELWKSGQEAPGVLTDEYLATVGYQPVTKVQTPYNPVTQELVAQLPTQNAEGKWEILQTKAPLDPAIVANNCHMVAKLTPEITAILQAAGFYDRIAAEVETRRVQRLWESASRMESQAISATVAGLVTRGVIQNKPKALAVQSWINTLWAEYYTRKESGSDDMNFASVGAMPYTVPELAAELA